MIRDLASRVENCVVRWLGHIECECERSAKRINDSGGGRGTR